MQFYNSNKASELCFSIQQNPNIFDKIWNVSRLIVYKISKNKWILQTF